MCTLNLHTLGVSSAFSSQDIVEMRWFGNMGELRKPEGEKSSCGVTSPLNRLPGVCVVVVKAPFELNGVDIACCGGGSDKNDDDDCLQRAESRRLRREAIQFNMRPAYTHT